MSIITRVKCEKTFVLEDDLELCELLQNREYSLNAVNHYGDNLLHVGAANGCMRSVQMILGHDQKFCVDRKNKFGWTSLMHAVRTNEPETVKALLKHGADVTQRNYLGVSMLSLAAGVSQEMFEIIHDACPSVLKNSINDDVTPLCVAAMKNDKKLFLKLIDMGLKVENENTYTHLAMQHSTIPEIRSPANPPQEIEKYWTDRSDNIPYCGSRGCGDSMISVNQRVAKNVMPSIFIGASMESKEKQKMKSLNVKDMSREQTVSIRGRLSLEEFHLKDSRSVSPNLIYNRDLWFAGSSNLRRLHGSPYGVQPSSPNGLRNELDYDEVHNQQLDQLNLCMCNEPMKENLPPITLQRVRDIHSIRSTTEDNSIDHNASLSYAPEFSPSRSPCLPSNFRDEDVCGADTPTPPHYKTPPRGMVLNSDQAKLVITLRQFDLEHHISRFLAEEVDMSLFLTLNDQDLTEIGIQDERDRKALLAVIDTYTKYETN